MAVKLRTPTLKRTFHLLNVTVQRKAARFCLNNYQPTDIVTGKLRDLGWFSLKQGEQQLD